MQTKYSKVKKKKIYGNTLEEIRSTAKIKTVNTIYASTTA